MFASLSSASDSRPVGSVQLVEGKVPPFMIITSASDWALKSFKTQLRMRNLRPRLTTLAVNNVGH